MNGGQNQNEKRTNEEEKEEEAKKIHVTHICELIERNTAVKSDEQSA